MKKSAIILLLTLLGVFLFFFQKNQGTAKYRVAILSPVQHQAIDDIVKGFSDELELIFSAEIQVDSYNAQGDPTIQKSLLDHCQRQAYDLVACIGTDSTLMAYKSLSSIPLLGLDVSDQIPSSKPFLTAIREASVEPSLAFLKALKPNVHKVSMFYSSSDKNYKMMEIFKELAKNEEIEVQMIMIQNLSDMYVLAQTVDKDSDFIFIAKDHLLASGITTLSQAAKTLKIPLFSSDSGTVSVAAAIALGNKEEDIGREGARLTARILKGEAAENIPIKSLEKYSIFVNQKAMTEQGLDMKAVEDIALKQGYSIEKLGAK